MNRSGDWLTVRVGDNRAVLPALPDASVHCVVTSPPYWGLRDYGTATWDGGDAECDHAVPVSYKSRPGAAPEGRSGRDASTEHRAQASPYRDTCGKCGARRVDPQLGLEATPEEYVANLVAVFRKVRRVLRDDGTVWLNLGDSYMAGESRTTTRTASFPATARSARR